MIGRLREVTVSYESAAPTLELEALGWAPRGIKFFEDASSAFREVPPQWWSSLTHEEHPSPSVAGEPGDLVPADDQVTLAPTAAGLRQARDRASDAAVVDLHDQGVDRLGAVAAEPLVGGVVASDVPLATRELEARLLRQRLDLRIGHPLGVAHEDGVLADLGLGQAGGELRVVVELVAVGAVRVLGEEHPGLEVLAGRAGHVDLDLVGAAHRAVRVATGVLAGPAVADLTTAAVAVDAALRTVVARLALVHAGIAGVAVLAVAVAGAVARRFVHAGVHTRDVLVRRADLAVLAVAIALALDLGGRAAGLRGAAARGEGGEGGGGDDDLVQAHGLSFGGSVLARQVVGIRFVGRLAVRLTEKLNDILRCDQNYLREVYNSL